MGFAFYEWHHEVEHYDEKLAMPIRDRGGRLWGCLAVSITSDGSQDYRVESQLNTVMARQVAATFASAVAKVIAP